MAKKQATTKKEKGMVIYLTDDAGIKKVVEGNDITFGEAKYLIVAEVNDDKVDTLLLYVEKQQEKQFEVCGALFDAFAYDCKCSRSCFLQDADKLKDAFLKNVERKCMKFERTEIKKFMYATYVQAREMLD